MRLEQTILKNLIKSEDYTRKVLPFLKEEYFGKLPLADLCINQDGYDIVVEKYPRFAFGLITSFYVWKSYGL